MQSMSYYSFRLSYSKLPVKYTLGSNEGLIATNTKSGVKDIEDDFNVVMSEDSDEEDTLFPH